MTPETTYSYTEWAAQQRYEEGGGLNPQDKIRALLAECDRTLDRRAMRRQAESDKRARRDAREQFLARLEAL